MKALLRASLLGLLILGAIAGFAATSAPSHVPGAPCPQQPNIPR